MQPTNKSTANQEFTENPIPTSASDVVPTNFQDAVLAESGIRPDAKVYKIGKKQIIIGLVVLLPFGILFPPLLIFVVFVLLIFGVTALFARKAVKKKISLDQTLSRVAAKQGWQFFMNRNIGRLDGRIFLDSIEAQDLMIGTLQNLPLQSFNTTVRVYTPSHDGGQYTDYGYTVMMLGFNDLKPCFSCSSLKDRTQVKLRPRSSTGKPYITQSLEGEFNNYFKLEVEQGSEIEVLEIFNPSFMDVLMQKYQNYSFEMTPHNFYMYIPRGGYDFSQTEYESTFNDFQLLAQRFSSLMKRVDWVFLAAIRN